MKQTARAIQKNLSELRRLIESTDDPVITRIAYSMEYALRWATEDTVGWGSMVQEAKEEALLLRKELGPTVPAASEERR